MQFRVLLFARYAELFGAPEVMVSVSDHASVADVVAALRILPGGASLPALPFVAVNQMHSDSSRMLLAADELALLPPLAGG